MINLEVDDVFQCQPQDLDQIFGKPDSRDESIGTLYFDVKHLDRSIKALWSDCYRNFGNNISQPLERIRINTNVLEDKISKLHTKLTQAANNDPENIAKASIAIEIACRELVSVKKDIELSKSELRNLRIDDVMKSLEEASKIEQPASLAGIVETRELKNYNYQLRQIEAQVYRLSQYLHEPNPRADRKAAIRELNKELHDQYSKLQKEKEKYVKRAYPNNPVYAMAVSQVLPTGSTLYTCGTEQKIENIIEAQGFTRWVQNAPATCYGKNFVKNAWGYNEMGEKGYYFSIKTDDANPYPYLGSTGHYVNPNNVMVEFTYTHALKCELSKNLQGVTVPSITELRKEFNFTSNELEYGYNQIHKNYPFLQSQGLYPKDTEVVFTASGKALKPVGIVTYNELDESTVESNLHQYYNGKGRNCRIHSSWLN